MELVKLECSCNTRQFILNVGKSTENLELIIYQLSGEPNDGRFAQTHPVTLQWSPSWKHNYAMGEFVSKWHAPIK